MLIKHMINAINIYQTIWVIDPAGNRSEMIFGSGVWFGWQLFGKMNIF